MKQLLSCLRLSEALFLLLAVLLARAVHRGGQ